MQLIDHLHLAMVLLFGITALQRFKRQGESFYIRLILAGWFTLTTIFHDLPVELVRNGSAIGIVIMVLFEATAPYMRKYWAGK